MNALKLVCAFAAVAVCRAGVTHSSVLSPHVALPHSLPHDPVGVQQVPVAAVGHHAPLVTVKHHGSPLLHVAPSVHKTSVVHHAAPVAVSRSAYGAVSHSVPVVASHGVVGVSHSAPVAVAHAAHGVAHGAVAVSSPVGVAHAAPVAVSHAAPVAVAHSAPVAVSHAAPLAISHPAPLAVETPVKSQYHAQDELGQYSFGYNAGDSARQESRDAYGNVRGSFSYVDSYGNVQSQHYVADDYGFRVSGTNLPRHKRSYGTYPASTGPLATVSHVAPVVHAAPAVASVAHVAHAAHAVAPVATISHAVAPAAHVAHAVAPVAHSGVYGYSSPLRGYSYGYRTGPSVSTYRSYTPVLSHAGVY
ncbi:larval/pupal cuticle protein H1C-like [Penaeus indicus]|uniref:larval/pupal cuticle protein H1C-like n=1 Tax=Penaeus indicus TaxID=29960 RepID=UPI00300D398F